MSQYHYSPLSSPRDSIRLLRLMPHEDETADIQCELFEYSLQNSCKGTHPYDALSYVWGDPYEKLPIFIHGHSFHVTVNLRAALSHLRNHSIERILWVDAICIHQENLEEKENQIQAMAKIYGQANRVVVWLGEAADDSDLAFEEIRVAGHKKATNSLGSKRIQQAVLALLQRPWFRRIWILQEVAAARHVLILCGFKKIDGYAFCLGVDSLKNIYEARQDLQGLIRSVTYLIREAIFRPDYLTGNSGQSSLDICPLGELIDMYHAHGATKRHDKVYALLGMSSDDLSKVDLLPDYRVPWEKLFQRLAKYLLPKNISVETWADKEIAVIKSKGCILGKISSVRSNIGWNGGQDVDVISRNISGAPGLTGEWSSHWTLHPSAKSIMIGDVICYLQGASKPTIVRVCKDYWAIVIIAATPPHTIRMRNEDVEFPFFLQLAKLRTRNLQFIWNWENSLWKLQGQEEYEESEVCLDKVLSSWNSALVLGDLEEYKRAEEKFREAMEGYEMVFGKENIHDTVAERLPLADGADLDLMNSRYSRPSRPPLSWAAERGHKAVVELLLRTEKANVNLEDMDGQTPLSLAAVGGHLAIVERLLQEKAKVNPAAGYFVRTALQAAAGGGHLAVVEAAAPRKGRGQ
ncbi:HET-domain-containing protein [Mytilinidion resinicola]|uniref:HET-domain-containing protein n=1 Tax=Mytilinidion resinicola TaxID=574789 RepID=A0A6A6Y6J5_9PEZI|nr:HET-domain-containing protein [Mytilinidion resinicola]KAF2804422.1 HET-domain-containing protein [Mytilinidion resinicola]